MIMIFTLFYRRQANQVERPRIHKVISIQHKIHLVIMENTATESSRHDNATGSDKESVDFGNKLAMQFSVGTDDSSPDVVFDLDEDNDNLAYIIDGDNKTPIIQTEQVQEDNGIGQRKHSEVGRCMYLYRLLSADLSQVHADDVDFEGDDDQTENDGAFDCVDGEVCVDGQVSADGLDDIVTGVNGSPSDLIAFIKEGVGDARGMMASYLSTGNVSTIILTPDNFHLFLHVAISLNLKQLKRFCIRHFFSCDDPDVINVNGNCSCLSELRYEAQKGFHRSLSTVSVNDENTLPEYYIAFSKTQRSQEKVTVVVINMSAKRNVLQRIIDKPLGKGFACCSVELKESPFIFISGGGNKRLDQFWKYDVIGSKWDKKNKLVHGRSSHSMAACDNSLFVFGGKEVSCIEKYDIKEKKWKDVAFLATPVHMAVSILYDKKVYIFGGKTLAGPVSTVQCFDTQTNKVEKLQDLPCPIFNGQAVVINDNIYIASGQGHMIFFEPRLGVSDLCSKQPIRREQFGMFAKNERVYIAGGEIVKEDETENNPQYRYDPEDDSWVEKCELNMFYPVYASCIIQYPKKCPVIPFDT